MVVITCLSYRFDTVCYLRGIWSNFENDQKACFIHRKTCHPSRQTKRFYQIANSHPSIIHVSCRINTAIMTFDFCRVIYHETEMRMVTRESLLYSKSFNIWPWFRWLLLFILKGFYRFTGYMYLYHSELLRCYRNIHTQWSEWNLEVYILNWSYQPTNTHNNAQTVIITKLHINVQTLHHVVILHKGSKTNYVLRHWEFC